MFIEYLPRQSFLHSLDIRTKMAGLICTTILLFLFNDPLYNLTVATFVGMTAFSARMPVRKIYNTLTPLIPVFILIMLFSGFSPPDRFVTPRNQEVLFYLIKGKNLGITVGGLLQGCTFLIRLTTMLVASSLITLTSPFDDFIQLLNKMKFPFEFSFAVTTALRFIPTMDQKRMFIIDAQKARGANIDEKGFRGYIKSSITVMIPMIVNAIRMANNLSMAMLIRGYGYSAQRTQLKQISFKPRDYVICFMILLTYAVGLYLRFILRKGIL